MESIQRVFFHELGHFVAHELNHKFYNGTEVEEIVIHPCNENINELCGYCKPINPSNENNPVLIERLSQHLGVLAHGCIFQSYFMQQNFTECMCNGGHGSLDLKKWTSDLSHFRQNNSTFASIEDLFFEKIVSESALDGFITLDVWNYIKDSNKSCYTIDVEKLRKDTTLSLDEYSAYYLELINRYQSKIRYSSNNTLM